MQQVSFIYINAATNDEVEMCFIPEFNDGNIYFYSEEYDVFWTSIDEVGISDKIKNFGSKIRIRPAKYMEIVEKNLFQYIKAIKVSQGQGKSYNHFYVQIQDNE